MNQEVAKKLKLWRSKVGEKENVELYRILHNKTIDDVATLLPKTKEEFLSIKGIGEKKFKKYGNEMLAIIRECAGNDTEVSEDFSEPVEITNQEEQIYTVSSFLDIVNNNLSRIRIGIIGEVTSVDHRGTYLFFSLKDKEDESLVNCFMWNRDYEMCGIELQEGMELTAHGTPEVYKRSGRFSFRTDTIELVGEGALKKAYEELKRKLQREGLFEEERKKPIPDYPHKIGLITSRDGAVINDFLNNIGRFGYKIKFMDSRVEGIMAVKDLINAVRYFKDNPVDVLVIIRGGGSLESLQAFNNEALIRDVIEVPMPVICGIGHDKDVPLLSYVADKAVSTPSIVAKEINKSWEKAVDKLDYYEGNILNTYSGIIKDTRYDLENASVKIKNYYQGIFTKVERYEQMVKNLFHNISYALKQNREKLESFPKVFTNLGYALKQNQERLEKFPKIFTHFFSKSVSDTKRMIDNLEKSLGNSNPERQLRLGYSIVTLNGKVVKSARQVKKGDVLINKFGEGKVQSEAKEIYNN